MLSYFKLPGIIISCSECIPKPVCAHRKFNCSVCNSDKPANQLANPRPGREQERHFNDVPLCTHIHTHTATKSRTRPKPAHATFGDFLIIYFTLTERHIDGRILSHRHPMFVARIAPTGDNGGGFESNRPYLQTAGGELD